MLLYRSEQITLTFITESLKDEKKGVCLPTYADFAVILSGILILNNC